MKKVFVMILSILMALTIVFSVSSCKKAEDQQGKEEIVNTPTEPAPKAIPEPGPEAIDRKSVV